MTPADIDRVFGRGRLRMVTGDHVEVFREASLPGERRRYTKRFLATPAGDFRHWTEREWRILARLVGHGIVPVPDVVQFDLGAADRPALVQTYDAGVTVDHWATLLPVERDGSLLRHVFEDCAHWWALARHCLIALDAIHELRLVHLDLKADNVCIPVDPADFDPHGPGQRLTPRFEQIALIDFAFSLVSGESLVRALPIARQAEYDYQSPRLLNALEAGSRGNLAPTRQLDWRCDVFSLAAMLRRYLPDPEGPLSGEWTPPLQAQARALVRRLLQAHDDDLPAQRPHAELIALASRPLTDPGLAASLQRGWTLAIRNDVAGDDSPTPVTRIALPVSTDVEHDAMAIERVDDAKAGSAHVRRGRVRMRTVVWASGLAAAAAVAVPLLGPTWLAWRDHDAPAGRNGLSSPATAQQEQATAQQATAQPEQRHGSTPTEVATAAPIGETAIDTESAPTGHATMEPSPAPAPALAPAPTTQSASAVALAMKHASATVPVMERPSGVAPATAVRPEPGVARGSEGSGSASAGTAAGPTRPIDHAPTGPRGRVAATESARARAMAYLSTRGPAPRFAQSSGASSTPAPARTFGPAPAPAPTPAALSAAAVPATAPALAAAPIPATAPSPAPAVMAALPATPSDDLPAAPPRDYAARASELMVGQIPRIVQRAERLVLRVLFVAAHSDDAAQDDAIRRAASEVRREPQDRPIEIAIAVNDARRLNEAARLAFWRRGNVQEALSLQTHAFGANPLDAEVVGNLAFLHLKQRPRQAEPARQLALYALTLHDPRYPDGRIEDWNTLAIANALLGRDRDARNAWFVMLALAPNLEQQCRSAIHAVATYGEPLRSPVEAMLSRVHSSGRSARSPFCEWPPYWMATSQSR